jgi:DNA-binding MarR family transcriptional regulator
LGGAHVVTGARELRLYHRLQLAAHALAKHSDRRMQQAAGMSTAQVAVLSVVAAGAPVAQRDVARALGVNESAVTGMIGRLERAGALHRHRHGIDGRSHALELTTAGRRTLARSARAFTSVNETIEATLSSGELEVVADALERLAVAFGGIRGQGAEVTA